MSQTPTFAIGVLAEALPEGRSLTIAECAQAAEAAAAVYDLDSLVDFEQGERTYTQLWRTPYSEAYAIGWKQAGDTGFHDHDGSVGAVHVVRGTVAEEHIVLRPAGDWLARVEFTCGETFRFDGAHIHRMRHAAGRHRARRCTSTRRRSGARAPTSCPATARCAATASRATRSCARATRSRSTARSRIPRRRRDDLGSRPTSARSSELDAHRRLAARLAPDADQRRAHRGRRVAVRLLGARAMRARGGAAASRCRPKASLRRASTT